MTYTLLFSFSAPQKPAGWFWHHNDITAYKLCVCMCVCMYVCVCLRVWVRERQQQFSTQCVTGQTNIKMFKCSTVRTTEHTHTHTHTAQWQLNCESDQNQNKHGCLQQLVYSLCAVTFVLKDQTVRSKAQSLLRSVRQMVAVVTLHVVNKLTGTCWCNPWTPWWITPVSSQVIMCSVSLMRMWW